MRTFSTIMCGVALALILALPGCMFTTLMTARLEKPTFAYSGIELVETSQTRATVNFLFSAHNPNEAGLKNIICSYELVVDGRKFLAGTDIPLALSPKGDTVIRIPAQIEYADLIPVLGSVVRLILSGQKTIPVTIDAVFSGKPAIYGEAGKERSISFEMRLTRAAEIPLLQERRNRGQ